MFLPNVISFRPTVLAGCTSAADDIHTNIQTDRPRYGNMCRNRRNRFQRCSHVALPRRRCFGGGEGKGKEGLEGKVRGGRRGKEGQEREEEGCGRKEGIGRGREERELVPHLSEHGCAHATGSEIGRPVTKAKLTASPRDELGELPVLSVSWRRLPVNMQCHFSTCSSTFSSRSSSLCQSGPRRDQLETSTGAHHHRRSTTAAVDVQLAGAEVNGQVVDVVVITAKYKSKYEIPGI